MSEFSNSYLDDEMGEKRFETANSNDDSWLGEDKKSIVVDKKGVYKIWIYQYNKYIGQDYTLVFLEITVV